MNQSKDRKAAAMTINLKVPDLTELKPRITVFGVGGAGGNAVNNMIAAGLRGVEFVVANTDAQALMSSSAERRIRTTSPKGRCDRAGGGNLISPEPLRVGSPAEMLLPASPWNFVAL